MKFAFPVLAAALLNGFAVVSAGDVSYPEQQWMRWSLAACCDVISRFVSTPNHISFMQLHWLPLFHAVVVFVQLLTHINLLFRSINLLFRSIDLLFRSLWVMDDQSASTPFFVQPPFANDFCCVALISPGAAVARADGGSGFRDSTIGSGSAYGDLCRSDAVYYLDDEQDRGRPYGL